MDSITESDLNTKHEGPACKGQVFRGRENMYVHKGRYVHQVSMQLLKRKSCDGCDTCHGWSALEDIEESIGTSFPPIIKKIKDGALYRIEAINITRDWESGIVDGYDLEFIEVKEEVGST